MAGGGKIAGKKDPRGGLQNFGEKSHKLTTKDRERGAKKTNDLKALRERRSAEISEKCPEEAAADLWNAVKNGDLDKVRCYEIAYKIAGLAASDKSGGNTFNMNGPSQFLFGFKKIEPTQKDE